MSPESSSGDPNTAHWQAVGQTEKESSRASCRASREVCELLRDQVTVKCRDASPGAGQNQKWTLQHLADDAEVKGLQELVAERNLQLGETLKLAPEGHDEVLCILHEEVQGKEMYTLFLEAQKLEVSAHASEEVDSSSESQMRSYPQIDNAGMQHDIQEMEAELAEVTQALDQGKQKAKTAEEELVLLRVRAEHASDAVRMYSSSAEEGLQQLLLASERLQVDDEDPRSEQINKLKDDMRVYTDRLRQSMQEISALTSEVEELSAAYGPKKTNPSD